MGTNAVVVVCGEKTFLVHFLPGTYPTAAKENLVLVDVHCTTVQSWKSCFWPQGRAGSSWDVSWPPPDAMAAPRS